MILSDKWRVPSRLIRGNFSERLRLVNDEGGFTLVFMALFMTILLGSAGMVVDLGNIYLNIQRAQRASDAAALAGAAYLPGDVVAATNAATATLTEQGFTGSITKISDVPGRPDLMGVRVGDGAKNSFLQFFGMKTFSFTRSSVAGYRTALKLGSPSNVLGTETTALQQRAAPANSLGSQTFDLAMHGSGIEKGFGDRWSTAWCDPAKSGSGCSGYTNLERSSPQTYVLHVDDGYSGQLAIDVYDGGYSPQLNCNADPHLVEVWTKYGAGNPSYNPAQVDACTHDGLVGSPVSPVTTYTVKQVQATGPPKTLGECTPAVYTPLPDQASTPWSPYFDPAIAHGQYDPFYTYRKWSEFCRLDIGTTRPAGNYYITVETVDGSSQFNDYSLRASFMNGSTPDLTKNAHVSLYAKDRMTVNVHNNARYLTMPIVQMNRGAIGRPVHLEAFDLADIAPRKKAPYIRLVPTSDWKNNGFPITTIPCTYTSPAGVKSSLNPCQLNNVASGKFSAVTIAFDFNLPSTYSCDWSSKSGCWIKVEIDYGPSAVTSDTTSWNITDNGAPMRLYNASQVGF